MKDAGSLNVSHVSRKPLECIDVTTPVVGHVVEVTFSNHYNAYMFCSLIEHGFLSVFSVVGKMMLYSKCAYRSRCVSNHHGNLLVARS